jgi:hypothetical protein
VNSAILNALMTKLTSPNITSPATPVASPLGVVYTPVTGKAYLDVQPIMRAAPEHTGMRASAATLNRSIFQVDVVVPAGAGETPGYALADLVAARFPMLSEMVADGRRLQVTKVPAIASAIPDALWVRYPVSISFLVIA